MTTLPLMPNHPSDVLVASSNRALRQVIMSRLHSPQCRVEQAGGGAEALLQLESGFWKTLFLDPHLPDLDAAELAETIRKRFPLVEVVSLDFDRSLGPPLDDGGGIPIETGEKREPALGPRQPVPTLLLDEIGDMPLSLQPKLLRFLEQKEIQRLGSSDVVRVDVRVIAATNAHLPALVQQKRFREDLYYRISTFPIELPPLRDRFEDISVLARAFAEKFSRHAPATSISPQAMCALESHDWAGNVRELQNVMERALILAEDESAIRPEHLMLDTGCQE
jgi:DNA-binding NtrC family response regulator